MNTNRKRAVQSLSVLVALAANLIPTQLAQAASWVANTPMINQRYYASATLLPDGRVLVAGGFDGANYLANSEVYNPTNSTWSGTSPMLVGRYKHTATLLPNGKVMVTGGFNPVNGFLTDTELFDPTTLTWTNTGALHVGRDRHVATILANGQVLVTGGLIDSAADSTTSAELYNPTAGTWANTGSMSTARFFHSVTLLPNGKALASGGAAYINFAMNTITYFSSAELFDPIAGTWTNTGSMAVPRATEKSILLPNGKVLSAGGESTGGSIAGAELYNPATGTWTNTGSLSAVRERNQSALLPNGKVLLAGGDNQAVYYSTSEIYDPALGTWAPAASLSTARNNFSSALLNNGNLLVVGGENTTGFLSETELYTSSNITVSRMVLAQETKLPGGAFQFAFTNTPDVSFIVYAATDPSTPFSNWAVISGPTEVSPGSYFFTDPQSATNTRRFYRIRSP